MIVENGIGYEAHGDRDDDKVSIIARDGERLYVWAMVHGLEFPLCKVPNAIAKARDLRLYFWPRQTNAH